MLRALTMRRAKLFAPAHPQNLDPAASLAIHDQIGPKRSFRPPIGLLRAKTVSTAGDAASPSAGLFQQSTIRRTVTDAAHRPNKSDTTPPSQLLLELKLDETLFDWGPELKQPARKERVTPNNAAQKSVHNGSLLDLDRADGISTALDHFAPLAQLETIPSSYSNGPAGGRDESRVSDIGDARANGVRPYRASDYMSISSNPFKERRCPTLARMNDRVKSSFRWVRQAAFGPHYAKKVRVNPEHFVDLSKSDHDLHTTTGRTTAALDNIRAGDTLRIYLDKSHQILKDTLKEKYPAPEIVDHYKKDLWEIDAALRSVDETAAMAAARAVMTKLPRLTTGGEDAVQEIAETIAWAHGKTRENEIVRFEHMQQLREHAVNEYESAPRSTSLQVAHIMHTLDAINELSESSASFEKTSTLLREAQKRYNQTPKELSVPRTGFVNDAFHKIQSIFSTDGISRQKTIEILPDMNKLIAR